MSKMEVSILPLEHIGQVKPLLERSRFKPYRFFLRELKGELDSFWVHEIADLCAEERGKVFAATRGSQIVGLLVYTDLPWDTRVLGNRMGALKYVVVEPDFPQKEEVLEQLLDRTINWVISQGIEFLMCKTYADDMVTVHALEKKGFLLMDTLADYLYDSRRYPLEEVSPPPLPQGATIRLAGEDDLEELMTVARAAFRDYYGRFHSDERISNQQALQVYEEWIRSSCEGYADWIPIAEIEGRIAGYIVCRKPSTLEQSLTVRIGHCSIVGIHPDYHGLALFSILTHAAMELLDEVSDCVEGPTHVNNYPFHWGMEKLPWRIYDAHHSFHKWLVG
jgi:hypothetical protein